MIKLIRNNLYFKNKTSKFIDSGIMCNSCKTEPEDRIHFFTCKVNNEIVTKKIKSFVYLGLLDKMPKNLPFFYNTSLPLNHPTNIIHISTIKFIYNLRYLEIVPTISLINTHISDVRERVKYNTHLQAIRNSKEKIASHLATIRANRAHQQDPLRQSRCQLGLPRAD